MKNSKEYYKWIALTSVIIALSVMTFFYFKRIFTDDQLVARLVITQYISVLFAIVFSLLSIRSWLSILSFALSILVIYGIWNIRLGIH